MSYIRSDVDHLVRIAAFKWLEGQSKIFEDVLPYTLLKQGFDFQGIQVQLVGPQGIFKPKILPELPLTITTSANSPYDDSFDSNGFLLYRYRGTDPNHRDNIGLRKAMATQTPLVYLHGLSPGRYFVQWPVFIVGDSPNALTFTVATDEPKTVVGQKPDFDMAAYTIDENANARRAYLTTLVRQRLHQRDFRERVLYAYREQCSLCRLRHRELLDAAHIIPDHEPAGMPIVKNGLALCKLHHAAFDSNFLGIDPNYLVQIKPSILEEVDGPMLLHGLKELHRIKIMMPHRMQDVPDRELLEQRFERFKAA